MVGGNMNNIILSTSAFEHKVAIALIEWLKKYFDVDNYTDLRKHMFDTLGTSAPIFKKLVENHEVTKIVLYKAIQLGFDISTETGCYIKLYD